MKLKIIIKIIQKIKKIIMINRKHKIKMKKIITKTKIKMKKIIIKTKTKINKMMMMIFNQNQHIVQPLMFLK